MRNEINRKIAGAMAAVMLFTALPLAGISESAWKAGQFVSLQIANPEQYYDSKTGFEDKVTTENTSETSLESDTHIYDSEETFLGTGYENVRIKVVGAGDLDYTQFDPTIGQTRQRIELSDDSWNTIMEAIHKDGFVGEAATIFTSMIDRLMRQRQAHVDGINNSSAAEDERAEFAKSTQKDLNIGDVVSESDHLEDMFSDEMKGQTMSYIDPAKAGKMAQNLVNVLQKYQDIYNHQAAQDKVPDYNEIKKHETGSKTQIIKNASNADTFATDTGDCIVITSNSVEPGFSNAEYQVSETYTAYENGESHVRTQKTEEEQAAERKERLDINAEYKTQRDAQYKIIDDNNQKMEELGKRYGDYEHMPPEKQEEYNSCTKNIHDAASELTRINNEESEKLAKAYSEADLESEGHYVDGNIYIYPLDPTDPNSKIVQGLIQELCDDLNDTSDDRPAKVDAKLKEISKYTIVRAGMDISTINDRNPVDYPRKDYRDKFRTTLGEYDPTKQQFTEKDSTIGLTGDVLKEGYKAVDTDYLAYSYFGKEVPTVEYDYSSSTSMLFQGNGHVYATIEVPPVEGAMDPESEGYKTRQEIFRYLDELNNKTLTPDNYEQTILDAQKYLEARGVTVDVDLNSGFSALPGESAMSIHGLYAGSIRPKSGSPTEAEMQASETAAKEANDFIRGCTTYDEYLAGMHALEEKYPDLAFYYESADTYRIKKEAEIEDLALVDNGTNLEVKTKRSGAATEEEVMEITQAALAHVPEDGVIKVYNAEDFKGSAFAEAMSGLTSEWENPYYSVDHFAHLTNTGMSYDMNGLKMALESYALVNRTGNIDWDVAFRNYSEEDVAKIMLVMKIAYDGNIAVQDAEGNIWAVTPEAFTAGANAAYEEKTGISGFITGAAMKAEDVEYVKHEGFWGGLHDFFFNAFNFSNSPGEVAQGYIPYLPVFIVDKSKDTTPVPQTPAADIQEFLDAMEAESVPVVQDTGSEGLDPDEKHLRDEFGRRSEEGKVYWDDLVRYIKDLVDDFTEEELLYWIKQAGKDPLEFIRLLIENSKGENSDNARKAFERFMKWLNDMYKFLYDQDILKDNGDDKTGFERFIDVTRELEQIQKTFSGQDTYYVERVVTYQITDLTYRQTSSHKHISFEWDVSQGGQTSRSDSNAIQKGIILQKGENAIHAYEKYRAEEECMYCYDMTEEIILQPSGYVISRRVRKGSLLDGAGKDVNAFTYNRLTTPVMKQLVASGSWTVEDEEGDDESIIVGEGTIFTTIRMAIYQYYVNGFTQFMYPNNQSTQKVNIKQSYRVE